MINTNKEEISKILKLLIEASKISPQREKYIVSFQHYIWDNNDVIYNEEVDEILSDLAMDIDYYQHDPADRIQEEPYDAEKRITELIQQAISKIDKIIFS